MPEPISSANVPPSPLSEPAVPARVPGGSSLESVYDGVSGVRDSAEARSCSAPPGGATPPQLAALLEAFRENGAGGVYALLQSRPDLRAAIGRLGPDELECALVARDPDVDSRSLLPPWRTDAERIGSEVSAYFDDLVHSLTVLEGQATVGLALSNLNDLEADLPGKLHALREAAPGSSDAALASMLGVRGDAGDLERAQQKITQVRAGLVEFSNRLPDHTWTQSDFPTASARALEKIGLGGAPRGSIADLAAGESPGWLDEAVSFVLETVHIGLGGAEIAALPKTWELFGVAGVAARTTAQLGTAGVIGAGLVVEAYIHHLNEESHAAFVATGRLLGM